MTLTKEEQKAINALKRLEKSWPKTLWIFADGHSLTILKNNEDGKPAENSTGSFDQDYIVASVNIPNDGGGW